MLKFNKETQMRDEALIDEFVNLLNLHRQFKPTLPYYYWLLNKFSNLPEVEFEKMKQFPEYIAFREEMAQKEIEEMLTQEEIPDGNAL